MAIVKMKRLRLIALEQDRADLFSRLQHLGCVEIGESEAKLASPEWAALLRRDTSSSGDVKTRISLVQHAMDALRKYAPVKTGLFLKRPFMAEKDFLDADALASSLHIANTIGEQLSIISPLNSQETRLTGMKASLLPWTSLRYPLNQLSTEHVRITLGVCPSLISLDKLTEALSEVAPLTMLTSLSQDRDQHYLLLMYHLSEAEATEDVLKSFAFSKTQFKDLTGTAQEEITRIESELVDIAARRTEAEQKIAFFSDQRPALQHCLDRLQQDLQRESACEHLLTNGTIVFLEGWAAATGLDSLERELDSLTCAYTLDDATTEDTPPTLLKNPKWMSCINMVTEMYSLPTYHGGIDPNPLIFGFYIFFFGFMFCDIAYGIIISLVCLMITKKYRPKNTMGYLFHLGIYLGISTTIFGFLTGSFFGDVITVFSSSFLGMEGVALPYLFNPLASPMTVLVIAICIGIVQLLFGQCVHIYMNIRDRKPLEGFLDVVPWWIVFAGIALAVLKSSFLVLILGTLSLVATQGRSKKGFFGKLFGGIASLYDITSWLGDVLSYTRLMALMLATSVIASVMNILGALPGNIFAFFLIFVIGHTFNIGVNLIGTYVHAARLQYLEFFGKFYLEGGIPFKPLRYNTKYVDVTTEKEAE